MKIGIDVSQVIYGTGVSNYTKNLVLGLLSQQTSNEYLLFGGSLRRGGEIRSIFPSAKVYPFPPSAANLIWNKLHVLPIEKFLGPLDVLHTSDWSEPPVVHAKKVTTVHDLAPFLYPHLFPRDILRNIVSVHKAKLSWVKTESRLIIVPTEATKTDLVKLGFDIDRIRVIPEGVDNIFKPKSQTEVTAVKAKYHIHGKYILSVGIDPRKNNDRIIKAFEQASAGRDYKLVLVGNPKYVNISSNRNVRMLGYVDSGELASLYTGATALAYASLYEGFGLPILEAMACGCPVITSNISSMIEVAGGAALLSDPYDVDSIKAAMEQAMRGVKVLKEKGLKRVKLFTWDNCINETMKVYSEAVKI